MSRPRLVAASLLLMGLALVQDAGLIIADTKLDLAADPGSFLARAAHLWDGGAAFGQLQNQAYGYWWPMGSYFWLAELIGAPEWLAQRMWIGLVMVVAFVGCALLCRAMGVRSELACLVGAAAFATSPRMMSIIGGISIEAWPSAVAPWVLLPLVLGSTAGSPRRAAALSALAVGCIGGVNAAAASAALPLGAVWLLTRTPGPRRRSLMVWWPVCTFLATAWWLIPLFLLGAYSPPFLDWIESASVTTFPTTPFDALRGTSAWIPYVDGRWRAGGALLQQFHLVVNSVILMTLGLVGLAMRRNPHRAFLGLSLAVGMLLVSFGHAGAVQGWFAAPSQELLDAALAPLRNVHKFDPVIRLPLVVGLAWFLDAILNRPGSEPGQSDVPDTAPATGRATRVLSLVGQHGLRVTAVFVAVLAVVTTASPMLAGRLAPTGSLESVPDYWKDTADWLAEQPGDQTALLVPGSSFGSYVWGEPRDEPMQHLAEAPWAVRNAVPLSPAGTIRMLDAVEERLVQGRGSPGLAPFLSRAGVKYLVVRNDLARSADVPDPVLVHQAIEGSPGIGKVAQFGPPVGGSSLTTVRGRRILLNGGWQALRPAVEVYEVVGVDATTSATPTPVTVIGGPEDLIDLADLGLLPQGPVVLGVHAATERAVPGELVLTDGLRARERFFGRVHDTVSQVLVPGQQRRTANPVRDYRLTDDDRWSTLAEEVGGMVEASSSQADADAPGGARPGYQPWAAVDGDQDSSFRSATDDDEPSWRLTLPEPRPVTVVSVHAGRSATTEQRVQLRTESGVLATLQLRPGERRTIPVSTASTSWVEVRRAGGTEGQLDLAEVTIPGVELTRWLRTPEVPPEWGVPDQVVLRSALDYRTGCARVVGEVRCSPEQQSFPSEEPGPLRRIVTLPEAAEYPANVWVRPDPRQASDLIQDGQFARVTASSTRYDDPSTSAVAVIDRRRATSWLAARVDTQPRLALALLSERRIRGILVRLDPTVPARAPTMVRVSWEGGSDILTLDAEGRAALERPVVTSTVEIQVLAADDAVSLGFDGTGRDLPIGVTTLRVAGVPEVPLPLTRLPSDRGCGSGPTLRVHGRSVPTRVSASPVAILLGEQIEAELCTEAPVRLSAGENEVELTATADFLPVALVLGDQAGTSPAERSQVMRTGPVSREITDVEAGELVALAENHNPGWVATQDGTELEPVVVDGWRQGWWTISSAPVEARFAPNTTYRYGLIGGGLLALLLGFVLATSARTRANAPATGPRRIHWIASAALGVIVAGLLGGWPPALVVAALAVPVVASGRRGGDRVAVAVVPLIAAAGVGYVLRPWGASEGWAGSTAWVGVVVVITVGLVVVATGSGRATSPRSRSAGRSTTR